MQLSRDTMAPLVWPLYFLCYSSIFAYCFLETESYQVAPRGLDYLGSPTTKALLSQHSSGLGLQAFTPMHSCHNSLLQVLPKRWEPAKKALLRTKGRSMPPERCISPSAVAMCWVERGERGREREREW